MKKQDIVNLIKYHMEGNNEEFINTSFIIAKDFDKNGEENIASYLFEILSGDYSWSGQCMPENSSFDYLHKVENLVSNDALLLPECVIEEIKGIINVIGRNVGINKFLFEGIPGTGKTESAKTIAKLLNRDLYQVNFTELVDSKLGQTSKNIEEMFREINKIYYPEKSIILFDEIDTIALDRINDNDLREMGRATSTMLRGFDNLNKKITIIATTNLFKKFDKALTRRFDFIVNFDRYTKDDLVELALSIADTYIERFDAPSNKKLLKKILMGAPSLPNPAEIENLIKVSVAFSKAKTFNYLKSIYKSLYNKEIELTDLKDYTTREIEILLDMSKSTVSRKLKEVLDE